ncbi:hydroxyisourate hydrolase [Azohydromonas caseinilytica]|uniref:Hydroxyisourate hydrolase n=1 Tax=Azohydromonas caseinilytica TaxID=2728836 RepID=A0A848FGD4_9BURK|nr:hydroxyisourate hydrolase [Azohydromonas caseinilytica]NML17210.1 hydroxyisourate hydrolase [Azohydromonas caseinilytica]
MDAHQDPTARRRFLRTGLALGTATLPALAGAAEAPAGLATAPRSQAGAPPRLTVHAIDMFHGATGAGLRLSLSRFDTAKREWQHLLDADTVAGGRTAQPLLDGEAYRAGRYELLLHLGDYFSRLGAKLPQPAFLTEVPLRFVIRDAAERVHLPVLFSPWGYSYYRGS